MSLFDFFFPDEAQATHLRRLADSTSKSNIQARIAQTRNHEKHSTTNHRIEELESEVGQLTIVIEALLETLSDHDILSREDIARKVGDIDARDGVIDGRITKNTPSEAPLEKPKFRFPE